MTNNKSLLNLILGSFIIFSLLSCQKDDDDSKSKSDKFSEIKEIATFHGDLDSDIVVVNTQGGPLTELDEKSLKYIIAQSKTSKALYVNVHQAQTKDPSKFSKSDITFEEAKAFDEKSVENLKEVIDYFKAKKKTTYVLGISFGAFVTQELIADNGIDVADGYLIAVGRLNIEKDTWQPFSEGKYTRYVYDDKGDFTIVEDDGTASVEERNMSRLAAGLGFNRYTERLDNIDNLSKITYVYGNRDQQVGPLSSLEVQFLKKKGATVVLLENGNHDAGIDKAVSMIKEKFDIG